MNFKKAFRIQAMGLMCLLLLIPAGCDSVDLQSESDEHTDNLSINANQDVNEGTSDYAITQDANDYATTQDASEYVTTQDTSDSATNQHITADDLEEVMGSVADIADGQMRIIEGVMISPVADEGHILAMQMDTQEDTWLTVYFDVSTLVEISEIINGDFENLIVSEGTIEDLKVQETVQIFGERVNDGIQAYRIVIGRHTFTVD